MKAFTDLEQSKKLAEILPIESADMWWAERYTGRVENYEYIVEEKPVYYLSFTKPSEENYSQDTIKDIPCWSLAALLDVLPYPEIWQDHSTNRWACSSLIKDTEYLWESENPVDSCVEVIIKLHKEGLL